MKKYLFPIVLSIPLTLAACSATTDNEQAQEDTRTVEQRASDTALEACTNELEDYVVEPARAEFIGEFSPEVKDSLGETADAGEPFYTLEFADVRFISGGGAPETQKFGCATYHGENGELTQALSEVVDKSESFGFDLVCQKFTHEELDISAQADSPEDCKN